MYIRTRMSFTGSTTVSCYRITQAVAPAVSSNSELGWNCSACFGAFEKYIELTRRSICSSLDVLGYFTLTFRFQLFGTGLMGTWLNGYLALQGNMLSGTARLKHVLKLPARKILGTRWAKYPFSRFRTVTPVSKACLKRAGGPTNRISLPLVRRARATADRALLPTCGGRARDPS